MLERLGNAFRAKKSSNLSNFIFLPSLPAQIPASAQLNQWDFGQERAGFSPKAPVLQLCIYLQKRPVGYPWAGRQLGNSQEGLEYFDYWSFLKAEHKFFLLLVDGFIICSEIRAFFAYKPCAPTNSCILCQFPSVLGMVKGDLTNTYLPMDSLGWQLMGLQTHIFWIFFSFTSSKCPQSQ